MFDLQSYRQLEAIHHQQAPGRPTVVLCHGYGANAFDLAPLSNHIPTPGPVNWLFPNAPHHLSISPGFDSRAWFPIDMEALQMAMLSGQHRDLSKQSPEDLTKSAGLLLDLLAELAIPMSEVILGGFSQGAMLAIETMLRCEQSPRALVILSGTLIHKPFWQQELVKKKGLSFFQSHGDQDPILGFSHAKALNDLLKRSGLIGQLHSFHGAHEIPSSTLQELAKFLSHHIPAGS